MCQFDLLRLTSCHQPSSHCEERRTKLNKMAFNVKSVFGSVASTQYFCSPFGPVEILPEKFISMGEIPDGAQKEVENLVE